MMRGPADLPCSHCKELGAPVTCSICKLQVCERCTDPLTCSKPVGRVLMLGRGARMRAVDPRGHHAIVKQPLGDLALLDLRNRRWLGAVQIPFYIEPRHIALTDDGRVLYREQQDGRQGTVYVAPVCLIDALTGAKLWRDDVEGPSPALLGVTPRQKYIWYTTGQLRGTHVRVLSPPVKVGELAPLDRIPVDAATIDEDRDLLATGCSGLVAVHRIQAGFEPWLRGTTTGQIVWLAFGDPGLITLTQHPGGVHVEIRELAPGLELVQSRRLDGIGAAAVSRDGAYLALGIASALHVYDLRDRTLGTHTIFDEHTNRISCLAFGADHVLISGDEDRRIILRPRGEDGRYTRDLVEQELEAP